MLFDKNSLNNIHFGKNPMEGGIPAIIKIDKKIITNSSLSLVCLLFFIIFFSIMFIVTNTVEK